MVVILSGPMECLMSMENRKPLFKISTCLHFIWTMVDNHLNFPPFLMSLKLEIFIYSHFNDKLIIYFKNSHLNKSLRFLLFHEKKANKIKYFTLQNFSEDITSIPV